MTTFVAVIGEGRLADLVSERLGAEYCLERRLHLRDGFPVMADLALVVSDGWNPGLHMKAEEVFGQSGIPWLRIYISFGEGAIGPLVRPDMPGCSQCADKRRLLAGADRQEMWRFRQKWVEEGGTPRDVWASRTGLLTMMHLLVEETRRILQDGLPETVNRMYLIHLMSLTITRHSLLPDPLCPVCGELPEDSADRARIELEPSRKAKADGYRTRSLAELKPSLLQDYFDGRTGLLNGTMQDLLSPFADASVNLPLFGGDEGCAGRTHRYTDSLPAAMLEGLERHCGMMPRGKRTAVHDSYRRLQPFALHPADTGLHEKEQYKQHDFPFQPFDPDREMDWVWGYSVTQERPILVPESLAYYSTGCGHGFVYETSNGCALGGSLEEAIFYGILEAVERDSFLLTWYAQLPLPRLDPDSAGDPEIMLMINRLRATAGYDVLLFDSTMEHGIPSVWAIAKNRTNKGLNLICAAGAHPDPIRAVQGAIHELAGMLLTQSDKFEANRATYLQMLEDSDRVAQMEDHSMLYGLPEAEDRLRFLLDDRRPWQTFAQRFPSHSRHPDLTDDLKELLQAIQRAKMDVIVVDQSSAETRRNRLHCVKVLIPGLLPMTFGYHLTRLTGLDRVLTVPVRLGYVREPLAYEQLNPFPHPFP